MKADEGTCITSAKVVTLSWRKIDWLCASYLYCINEGEALLQIKPLPGFYDLRAGKGLYRAIATVT